MTTGFVPRTCAECGGGGGGSDCSCGLTDAELRATPVEVSGTVAVSNFPASQPVSGTVALDAATLAALENVSVIVTSIGEVEVTNDVGNPIPVTGTLVATPSGTQDVNLVSAIEVEVKNDVGNPLSVIGPLTDAQLRATPVPVSGTVAVSNPGLTDTQLRATPVPVSGTVTITDGSGPVTVDGTVAVSGSVAVTGPLTDAQLRATAVPVSGPLTDTQLRATPVPVSGTVTITDGSGPVTVDGTVAVSNFPATQPVSGTVAVSNFPASVEVSNDVGNPLPVSGTVAVSNPGLTDTQLRATPVPVSGTVTITDGSGPVTVDGTVTVANPGLTDAQLRATPVPVSGTVAVSGEIEVKNDSGNPLPVNGTVSTNLLALTSWDTGQATIASSVTAVNVIPAALAGRKTFAVKALSTNSLPVFVGPLNTVTTANGYELAAGDSLIIEVDTTAGVWVIGSSATSQGVCFAEVA